MKRALWMLGLLGAACGPTTIVTGTMVTDAQLCHLKVGTSTPSDVSRLLGPPQSTVADSSGIHQMTYSYADGVEYLGTVFTFSRADGSTTDLLSEVSRVGTLSTPVPSCINP